MKKHKKKYGQTNYLYYLHQQLKMHMGVLFFGQIKREIDYKIQDQIRYEIRDNIFNEKA